MHRINSQALEQQIEAAVRSAVQSELSHYTEQIAYTSSHEVARDAAKEAIRITLSGLGFDVEDTKQMQADLLYIRRLRTGSEFISARIWAGVISVLIGSGLWLLWTAIKGAVRG